MKPGLKKSFSWSNPTEKYPLFDTNSSSKTSYSGTSNQSLDKLDSSSLSQSQIINANSAEFQTFLQNYSRRGQNYNDGTVLNLEDNPFLKVGETEDLDFSHGASELITSTRAAFKVTDLSQETENTLRVKFINYGNYNAMCELEAAHVYNLTGMVAPKTKFLIHKEYPKRDNGAPQLLIASPMITGYSDLGDFFVSPVVNKFIRHQSLYVKREVRDLQQQILRINEKSKDVITAEDKTKRLNLMKRIYSYLPDYFHQEIEKAFGASKLVANWDFANLSLNNIGCRWTLDGNNVVKFESAFVDFGNSGPIGFGGNVKGKSFTRANTEAKKKTDKPRDYDPELTFTRIEQDFIQQKGGVLAIAQELNEEEARTEKQLSDDEIHFRRKIIFKEAHHIRPQEASFQISDNLIGMLTVSDLPRNLAFGFLLEPAIKAKTALAIKIVEEAIFQSAIEQENLTTFNLNQISDLSLANSLFRDNEIEMAYRFSLITDEAIDTVIDKWHLQTQYPNIFPIPTDLDPEQYSANGVKASYKQRRDFLANSVPPEIIARWKEKNPAQALNAEYDVRLASLEEAGIEISQPPTTASPQINSGAHQLKEIIEQKFSEIRQLFCTEYPELMTKLSEKKSQLRNLENNIVKLDEVIEKSPADSFCDFLKEQRENISQQKNILETTILQKEQEAIIKFISDNMENWKSNFLVLKDTPNCNPLDIERLRKIYHSYPQTDSKARKGIIFDEQNHARNAALHEENVFVFNNIIEILDRISTLTHDVSPPKGPASSTNHSQLTTHSLSNEIQSQP